MMMIEQILKEIGEVFNLDPATTTHDVGAGTQKLTIHPQVVSLHKTVQT